MKRIFFLMICFLLNLQSSTLLANSQEEKRKDLILQCRYYNGEAEEPEPSADAPSGFYSFWGYEKLWVEWTLNDDPEIKDFEEWVNFYHLESKDGDKTPLTLKAILLNRFLHWGAYGPPEEEMKQFEEWYTQDYLKWKTNGERQAEKE